MDIEDELKVVGQNQQTLEVRIVLFKYDCEAWWIQVDMVDISGGRTSRLLR